MRRPSVLRRLRVRVFDRRMAAGAFSLAAVVVLVAVAVTRAPAPARDAQARDPQAARDMVALMRAGEHASWLARYGFTRTLADGRALRQPLSEARAAGLHVMVSGSAMTVERNRGTYDCNLAGERPSCHASGLGSVVPASEVLRVAVQAGAYDVTRAPPDTIAGVAAQCFRVLGTGNGMLTAIGTETDICLSAAGVPLSERVVHPDGAIDERRARSVESGVSRRAVEALERAFGLTTPLGPQ